MLKQDSSCTVNYNPILNLRYINPNSMEIGDYQKTQYKITPRNLYRTVKFFNTVVGWFYDVEKIDLFLRNEDNIPIFNADYNKLSTSTRRSNFESCVLKAIPTIVEYENKRFEGINLYINVIQQSIPMILDEVETIFNILKTFSFPNEMCANLMAYQYALETNNITSDKLAWSGRTGQRSSNMGNPFDKK